MRGPSRELPAEFVAVLDQLERSYLAQDDPIRQSGFAGGAVRWRAERGPILEAVTSSGSLLDVGCANGYLLECLVEWAGERGVDIEPHGVDRGEGLVRLARERLPQHRDNLHVADAWSWVPPRQYDYVYALYDCVPREFLPEYVGRLVELAVRPGGRFILGAYGSRSRRHPPFEVESFLVSQGYAVAGAAVGGSPPITLFAWTDKEVESG